jgi:phosphoribosylaminoimidazolecarboxamide formyltransferase/IMP cyclohydrolase
MVRAAAKNCASVAVVVDPSSYDAVLAAVRAGGFGLPDRRRLAAAAFAHTAAYDVAVASWWAQDLGPDEEWPSFAGLTLERRGVLRYGENSHQPAALYAEPCADPGIAQAEQLNGKEMSYNNYVDADAAHRAAYDHDEPCVAIVKHTNPCGIAVAATSPRRTAARTRATRSRRSAASSPVNRPVTREMAEQVAEVFTEVVVAPAYDDDALTVLSAKKNLRLLRSVPPPGALEWRQVSGGVLVQMPDRLDAPGDDPAAWRLVSGDAADEALLRDLRFAWRACRAVKSNAILLASSGATVGVGMGQVNRVDSARLAVSRAGDRAKGAVAASDAFFPFADGLQVLLDAGVRAVVQPGGSVRDEEVVAAARTAGITMYLTGTRHFFH